MRRFSYRCGTGLCRLWIVTTLTPPLRNAASNTLTAYRRVYQCLGAVVKSVQTNCIVYVNWWACSLRRDPLLSISLGLEPQGTYMANSHTLQGRWTAGSLDDNSMLFEHMSRIVYYWIYPLWVKYVYQSELPEYCSDSRFFVLS
jgi:hypothetical protein